MDYKIEFEKLEKKFNALLREAENLLSSHDEYDGHRLVYYEDLNEYYTEESEQDDDDEEEDNVKKDEE